MTFKQGGGRSYSTHVESIPLAPQQALKSPPSSPSYRGYTSWSPTDSLPPEYTPTFNKAPLRRPTSYQSYLEAEDEYPLTPHDMDATVQFADQEVQRRMEYDGKLKKNIRRFRFVVRTLNLGCSLVIIGLIASNFAVFNATRFALDSSGNEIWSPDGQQPRTWPTIVLLCIASISAVFSVVVLLSYIKSVKWANRFAVGHATLSIGAALFFLIIWAISVGVFNFHDQHGEPDLWSRACHQRDLNKPTTTVNWPQYCMEQAWCSVCGILSMVFETLILLTFLLIYMRRKSKREVRQSQQYATFLRAASAVQESDNQPSEPLRTYTLTDEPVKWIDHSKESMDTKMSGPVGTAEH